MSISSLINFILLPPNVLIKKRSIISLKHIDKDTITLLMTDDRKKQRLDIIK